ncbi:uncharacterized protein LOC129583343 isoform X3 [Paramacrobiotus metropolitanus]|uniref:uncharacterized protein LOC129583343 isoform X3 n=1 Tax=Paramacrobiotus metropolitanus TaxID=2943436 RepID=UPI002445FDB2|nr:uncharacterized protein LOC129583343 isoform X3 [Paramacrobiotus metropolitanus]
MFCPTVQYYTSHRFCLVVESGNYACAMIRNELHLILEWIEFHRIQGVDHFIFYDDDSTDDIYLLPRLYADQGHPDLVEVFPANFRRYNQASNRRYDDYLETQLLALDHCNSRMSNVSQWLLITDVDEFTFSPKYHTIAAYLRQYATDETTREIHVPTIRFGSSGVQRENRMRLSLDPYENCITVITEFHNNHLLLTARNTKRGPVKSLDKDYNQRFKEVCAPPVNASDCHHAEGKSIWRPEMCGLAGIHRCLRPRGGRALRPSVKELRINHYAFRSKEHVGRLEHQIAVVKGAVFDALDKVWFSSVPDNSTEPYHEELMSRLRLLMT